MIVPEKCETYDVLFLLTPAESFAKIENLVTQLCEFENYLDQDESVEKILPELVQKYEPMGVAVETTGQQKGFIPWFREKMLATNIWFNFCSMQGKSEPGIQPSTNKLARFNKVLPLFKAHKIYFPEELKKELLLQEYLDELSLATVNGFKGHDDCLDNISQLGYIAVWEPSNSISEDTKKAEKAVNYIYESSEPEEEFNNSSYGSYIV